MLLLRLNLRLPITCDSSYSTTNCTSDAVCDAGTKIVELALGFLGFAFGILLGAGFL